MLDLGLEHLGIDVGKAKNGVQAVVTSVGQRKYPMTSDNTPTNDPSVLQSLQDPSCRAPVDKAATLVAAHNAAVEGLSRLPPIRLKPDEELVVEDPTPIAAHFKRDVSGSHSTDNNSSVPSYAAKSPTLDLPEPTLDKLLEEASTDALPLPSDSSVIKSSDSQAYTDTSVRSPNPSIQSPDATSSSHPTPESPTDTKRTHVASDLLLPFMIYSIVKANPPELVSHLLYIQRYRMRLCSDGEEAFCLINLLAVVEFLENVDLAALGLADSARVLSVADLAPLPIGGQLHSESPVEEISAAARLRGRVNQQVEELAGSANKVISGVVDSSFSALKGLLSATQAGAEGQTVLVSSSSDPSQTVSVTTPTPWHYQRAGFGLLRRGTEFTLASVTSSLPALQRVATGGSRRGNGEEEGRQLVEVPSRPESIKIGYGSGSEESDSQEEEEEEGEEDENEGEGERSGGLAGKSDVRSVRSFGSMISGESRDRRFGFGAPGPSGKERMSLSDRLANVSVRSRLGKDTGSIHAVNHLFCI